MLILTVPHGRRVALLLPDGRMAWVQKLSGDRLGFEAPPDVRILREQNLPAPQLEGPPCAEPK